MEFAGLMAGLDPTPRQLSSREKYQGSLYLLQLTRAAYAKCTGNQAQTYLRNKAPAQVTNELAEESLALAEQMW